MKPWSKPTIILEASWILTFCSLKGDASFTYEGDRTREDLVAFARRLMGPPVKALRSEEELSQVVGERDINFVFIGEDKGALWVSWSMELKRRRDD